MKSYGFENKPTNTDFYFPTEVKNKTVFQLLRTRPERYPKGLPRCHFIWKHADKVDQLQGQMLLIVIINTLQGRVLSNKQLSQKHTLTETELCSV